MVEANSPQEDPAIARRKKMCQELHERGTSMTENRHSMPMLSEDQGKDEWLHQEVLENGIATIAQRIVNGISPK